MTTSIGKTNWIILKYWSWHTQLCGLLVYDQQRFIFNYAETTSVIFDFSHATPPSINTLQLARPCFSIIMGNLPVQTHSSFCISGGKNNNRHTKTAQIQHDI